MVKTFKYKLYNSKKNKQLQAMLNIGCHIYNQCIALHKRYYRMYKKSLHIYQLQKHITKLKKLEKYKDWNNLGSQVIQNITERIKFGYDKFFRKENKRPPSFKKLKKYKSITLKTAGYKLLNNNKIKIGNKIFSFFKDHKHKGIRRELPVNIKTVTLKKNSLNDWYIFFVCEVDHESNKFMSGKSAGFDFGLKTFLTSNEGEHIQTPLFFKQSLNKVRKASKQLSSKVKGSNNRKKAKLNLARKHLKIANQREDFHWKLARELAIKYDELYFEDLCLNGMVKLWGRKINDLAFADFILKLKWQCKKFGKEIFFIDRFFPSSKTCHKCGHVNHDLTLKDRTWICPHCHATLDRDINAAINIYKVGTSTFRLDGVIPAPNTVSVV